jgi:hypothetical protein
MVRPSAFAVLDGKLRRSMRGKVCRGEPESKTAAQAGGLGLPYPSPSF